MKKKKIKFKDLWIWKFLKSGIFILFILLFGFFATIAYIGEKRKLGRNTKDIHVMQEEILYIRPIDFQEKQPSDTISSDILME